MFSVRAMWFSCRGLKLLCRTPSRTEIDPSDTQGVNEDSGALDQGICSDTYGTDVVSCMMASQAQTQFKLVVLSLTIHFLTFTTSPSIARRRGGVGEVTELALLSLLTSPPLRKTPSWRSTKST